LDCFDEVGIVLCKYVFIVMSTKPLSDPPKPNKDQNADIKKLTNFRQKYTKTT
jgi:hypothetical protein